MYSYVEYSIKTNQFGVFVIIQRQISNYFVYTSYYMK